MTRRFWIALVVAALATLLAAPLSAWNPQPRSQAIGLPVSTPTIIGVAISNNTFAASTANAAVGNPLPDAVVGHLQRHQFAGLQPSGRQRHKLSVPGFQFEFCHCVRQRRPGHRRRAGEGRVSGVRVSDSRRFKLHPGIGFPVIAGGQLPVLRRAWGDDGHDHTLDLDRHDARNHARDCDDHSSRRHPQMRADVLVSFSPASTLTAGSKYAIQIPGNKVITDVRGVSWAEDQDNTYGAANGSEYYNTGGGWGQDTNAASGTISVRFAMMP